MSDPVALAQELVSNAKIAAAVFSGYDQAQTDAIVTAVFEAAFRNRVRLARMAHDETGLGVFDHKVIKNTVGSALVYQDIINEKTVGILSEDDHLGITEIAQPMGPILGVTPVTNPTSTIFFKTLIALKSRNPIIFSPHKKALNCCREAARICYEAALSADAPEDCVQCIEAPSRDLTHALMSHPDMALVLATGGPSLVKAAYSSGTPAIGVGPGNVPVFICESADPEFAVRNIITSKTFDNGTICASEQAIVVTRNNDAALRAEFVRQHCHFLDPEQIARVEAVAIDPKTRLMHPDIVGQSVDRLAAMAGITVPAGTRILLAPLDHAGHDHPLSGEVLAPVLAYFVREDFTEAIKLCIDLNYLGGVGHTASIYANDEAEIARFAQLMNAGRVVVNTPSSHGGVGGIFNHLRTSFTLGCGAGGKNITTENITARNLINIKRVCRRRENVALLALTPASYQDESIGAQAFLSLLRKNT